MKQLFWIPLLLTLIACGEEKAEQAKTARYVKTYVVLEGAGQTRRIFPGKAEASETVHLSFQVSGELIEFSIKEGEEVESGQVLGRLDPIDFELEVRKTKALRDNAKVELYRSGVLLKKGFAAQSTYDLKETEFEVAESNLGTAQERLKDTQLIAPFTGKVAKTYVENYQYITAKSPILTLHQVNPIDITVQLPEDIVANLSKDKVTDHYVTFSVIPGKRFTAHYKESTSIADPATQTYDVVMTLDNPEGFNVLPGMTANIAVAFKGLKEDEGVLIPFSAVAVEPNGAAFVYVIDPNSQQITKRPIKIGEPQDEMVVVFEGLGQGDRIVTAGVNFLREGERVQTIPTETRP